MKRRHWLFLGLMAGFVCGVAGWKLTHPPPVRPPQTVEDRLLPYHRVPSPREGIFYVTAGDRAYEDLARLPRDPERLPDWQGVLYVAHDSGGEGVKVGPWTLFGDPTMIAHVAEALAD